MVSHSIDLEVSHCYAFQLCIGFYHRPNHADNHDKRLVFIRVSFYTFNMKNIEPVFRIAMMHSAYECCFNDATNAVSHATNSRSSEKRKLDSQEKHGCTAMAASMATASPFFLSLHSTRDVVCLLIVFELHRYGNK